MIEVWKDIEGYEGKYQISNMGNVRSLYVNRHLGRHNKDVVIPKIRNLTPTDNGHGYLVVALRKMTEKKNYYVHRLVAEAFLEQVEGKNVVNHIDYNTKNNSVLNLEWCSQKENIHHSIHRMRHERNSRLPTSGYKYIRKNKSGSYTLNIRKIYYKTFQTLQEAVKKRDEILEKRSRNSK